MRRREAERLKRRFERESPDTFTLILPFGKRGWAVEVHDPRPERLSALVESFYEWEQWVTRGVSVSAFDPATGRFRCPRCGSSRAVELVYGYPSAEMQEAGRRGKFELGGCMISGDGSDPAWRCRECGTPFGTLRERSS